MSNEAEEKNVIEMLRLASVAASEAAESELNRLEKEKVDFSQIPKASKYIKIPGAGSPLVRTFLSVGLPRTEANGVFHIIGNAYLVKWDDLDDYWLRIEYDRFECEEEPVISAAYGAMHFVLKQVDDEITVETN